MRRPLPSCRATQAASRNERAADATSPQASEFSADFWVIWKVTGTTWEAVTDADQVGAKFFYYCQSCAGFVCVDCLGLREGYPCDPAALESYPFQCPHCGGSVSVLRCDHASGPEAVEALLHIGDSEPPADISPAKLAAWTVWCNTLMNTREFQTIP